MRVKTHPESWATHSPGVYIIRNTVTHRAYIGSTDRTCKKRLEEHLAQLVANRHHCRPLQTDWNEYGPSIFLCGDAVNTFGLTEIYPQAQIVWFESALFEAYRKRYGPESTYNVATISRAPLGVGLDRLAHTCAEQYLDGIGVSINVISRRYL